MALKCSPKATEALLKSLPAVTKGGVAVTAHFYNRMLNNNPQLKNIFNTANQVGMRQPQALFNSIAAAAGSAVNDKGNYGLPPIVVDLIAHKHCALNITEDQYAIVGKELLGTIVDLLNPGQEIVDGWAELYGKVVNVLAGREKELYDESERKPGGWRMKRDFVIEKRVQESSDITSFHFVPKDGKELLTHIPGQYTTVWVHPKDWEFGQPRHYTLSDTHSGKHFRISVRKQGLVSSWLHDHAKEGDVLPLSPPYGVFTLNPEIDEGDVVLLSADNGVTPVIAMLNGLLKKYEKTGLVRNVQWLHETQSRQTHPFREYLQDVGKKHTSFKGHVWYAQPDAEAVKGTDYHYEGRMNLEKHRAEIEKPTANYYFCGPRDWMSGVREQLLAWGVPENRMHTEVFGPTLATSHRP